MFCVNTLHRTFYSICIFDNSSLININKKDNIFEIKLYFINYFIDKHFLPVQAENVYYNYSDYIVLSNYLNIFVNNNKAFFLLEIKKTISLLDNIINLEDYLIYK